jgi:hypothetical protein
MTVAAADAATTRNPIGSAREVLGFIVNIRFKIFRPAKMRAAFDVFCVIFVERLGSGIAFDAAERQVVRIRTAAIAAKPPRALYRALSHEDCEWLHRPPIP